MADSDAGGRVTLLTGASTGIGAATALRLATRGERLVLLARGEAMLESTARDCWEAGAAHVLVVPTDVGDADAVDTAFDAAVRRFGRVDAVVASAGVAAYGRFEDVPREIFDRVVLTNVVGTANVARAALRQFADQGGRGDLVLLGSLTGKIGAPFMSPYATTKWAVHGLARALQAENAGGDIHVGLVWPGGVRTAIYAKAASHLGVQGQPPPPVSEPEHVARRIVQMLDRPRRQRSVGALNLPAVAFARALPGLFDRLAPAVMHAVAMDRVPVAPHPGNVFVPLPDPPTSYGERDAPPVRLLRHVLDTLLVPRTPTSHRS